MKIAVMGAGGVGGYVGGRLAEAGHEITQVARGAHLQALQRNGLTIESPHGDVVIPAIRATDDPRDLDTVDLVLFTVKLGDTRAAALELAPIINSETRVITLQNGIDSAGLISEHVPRNLIAEGIIYIASYIKEPGVIINPGGLHKITVDEMDGDPAICAFVDACNQATGIEATTTDEPRTVVWRKFIALVAFSGATTLTRLPVGAVYEYPQCLEFMRSLLDENIAVANANGEHFDEQDADKIVSVFRSQPYGQKSSMLVDLEAGKPLELEWLSGRVHQMGLELGIPTPANSAVWAALVPYISGPPSTKPR